MGKQFYSSSKQTPPSLKQAFKTALRATLRFMVHRPQASVQSPTSVSKERYSAKAGLYAYLPKGEEQRDWLDRIYSIQ